MPDARAKRFEQYLGAIRQAAVRVCLVTMDCTASDICATVLADLR